MRLIRAAAAVLLVATATTSALVSRHDEAAADAKARTSALAELFVSGLAPGDGPLGDTFQRGSDYLLPVRNDGTRPFVLHSVGWIGQQPVIVDKLLRGQEVRLTRLPLGPCPQHRADGGFEGVEAVLQTHGRTRVVRFSVPENDRVVEQLNQRCGLYPVAESYQSTLQPSDVRPGHVSLDLSMSFIGSRDTEVLAVAVAPGIRAHVVERLPLTVGPDPSQLIPHLLTIVLDIADCAAVKASSALPPDVTEPTRRPLFSEVVLTARRPGEPTEKLFLAIPNDVADTFASRCGVPPVPVLLSD